jgi:hypothetical protein
MYLACDYPLFFCRLLTLQGIFKCTMLSCLDIWSFHAVHFWNVVVIDYFCGKYLLIIWFSSMCSRFYRRSLLCDSLDYSLIDKIPGRQNDRKTLLGELNWIFTAVTDTIAWNVLPRGSFFLVKNDFLIFHMCTSSDLVLHLSLSLLHVDNT